MSGKTKIGAGRNEKADAAGGRVGTYTTRQGEAVLDYLRTKAGEHVTAAEIAEHFRERGTPIGRATVYRRLERLVSEGKAAKYSVEGTDGACFEFLDCRDRAGKHFHLKCEECGKLVHTDGGLLPSAVGEILREYGFAVDVAKTVLYGKCGDCVNSARRQSVEK
ncbi:MAG: transcriptional repressor [Clostridiales bacterium]|nr:transcriptional repressor [Clostridiales bacterium]